MRHVSWTNEQLADAVATSRSMRAVIEKLGLVPAGGNYEVIRRKIVERGLSMAHFTGQAWNRGLRGIPRRSRPLVEVLVLGTSVDTHKLKRRLWRHGLKPMWCELCRWAARTSEGQLPLELDHVNGDRTDNRLENLRILCPNCHSLQPTHRARNRRLKRLRSETSPGGGTGRHATLKML